ncbi:MAG: hypothetical protein JXR91_10700 [Deltaproteobacteria bacterium]|nr:hypothetical protein [Deltaproteobacteria bacterium]
MARLSVNRVTLNNLRGKLKNYTAALDPLEQKKNALNQQRHKTELILKDKNTEMNSFKSIMESWISLFSDNQVLISDYIYVKDVDTEIENLFGVKVPKLLEVKFEEKTPDWQTDPLWLFDGIDAVKKLATFEAEVSILHERLEILAREFKRTNQKYNLFKEKLIVELKETIRVVQVLLGEQEVAAIAVSKAAKKSILKKKNKALEEENLRKDVA